MSCATESLLRRSVARNHHPIASLLKLTQRRLSRLQLSRECSSLTSAKLSTQLDSPSRWTTEGLWQRSQKEFITTQIVNYELPLPGRDESLTLPNNKKLAFHRLQHLKLRFGRDEKYKKEYTAFMNDMIKKGYAEKISSLEETRQARWKDMVPPTPWSLPPSKSRQDPCRFRLLSRVQG